MFLCDCVFKNSEEKSTSQTYSRKKNMREHENVKKHLSYDLNPYKTQSIVICKDCLISV